MTNDKELFWAKLNGDWNDANYRHKLARNSECLNILIADENISVRHAAIQSVIKEVKRKFRARDSSNI